jgi:hypothetical protein
MSEDNTGQQDTSESPLQGPCALSCPSPGGDLALRHACQRLVDALDRFIELRRSATIDPEAAEQSDTTQLGAARRKWSDALFEVSGRQATTWGGLQARYEAWMRLESEFGASDGRVFELAVDLVRNTYALAWESKGEWISSRRNASDFTPVRRPGSTFPNLLSRVGGSLSVFALRGRRSQT